MSSVCLSKGDMYPESMQSLSSSLNPKHRTIDTSQEDKSPYRFHPVMEEDDGDGDDDDNDDDDDEKESEAEAMNDLFFSKRGRSDGIRNHAGSDLRWINEQRKWWIIV